LSYSRPQTLAEAAAMLRDHAGGAKIIAGGQSLMPMLNLRVASAAALIDISRIAALSGIEITHDAIAIGAMTRHREVETSAELRAALPILPLAAAEIGHLAIRNRGTIGGSMVHADPAAEWPMIAALLDARLFLYSARGERRVRAREFITGPLSSAIEPDEILTAIRLTRPTERARFGFAELCRRRGDFALVAAACQIDFDARGECVRAAVAVAGANPTPVLVPGMTELIRGASAADEACAQAAEAAASIVDPSSDIHASAEFRRRMVRVMVERALQQCFTPSSAKGTAHG
jgi:carbon-monoxide dehydrogenase medium subunit